MEQEIKNLREANENLQALKKLKEARIIQLERERDQLKMELEELRSQSQQKPINPEAIALLQRAIKPEREGGEFKSNRATPLKAAIEKALRLLGG